ncbi:MAG: hypothetical protein U0792_07875 [Gemmataceae bacterium]
MFVRDDQVALDYLCTRPEVDVKRIGRRYQHGQHLKLVARRGG